MAAMGGTIRTSAHDREAMAPIMNVRPDRYIAPRKRACSGGTANGRMVAALEGVKKHHPPTRKARKPTAAK